MITCTGCGGERRMTDDQIEVPENGLCELELDTCPSDQELLMLEAFDALKRLALEGLDSADALWAKRKHKGLIKMWEAVQ